MFATIGIPYYAGSNAWVVAPSRSARRSALSLGGAQMGHTIPEIVHEDPYRYWHQGEQNACPP